MSKKGAVAFIGSLLWGSVSLAIAAKQPLTFEERVKAQEAIERVYYNHRIWPKENATPKPPFEQMVPKAQIEAKVTDYLKKSAALGKFWHRPIEAVQLQAEMDRMAKQTKDAATLLELFAALNNDPYIIAECLARPVLADRLIHNWYAYDTRFHSEAREKAEEALKTLSPDSLSTCAKGIFNHTTFLKDEKMGAAEARRHSESRSREGKEQQVSLDSEQFERLERETSQPGQLQFRETEDAFLVTCCRTKQPNRLDLESVLFRKIPFSAWWEETARNLRPEHPLNTAENAQYPALQKKVSGCVDGWLQPPAMDIPDPRSLHTAIWTGTEMIVWGGRYLNTYLNTGARYNPATDTWIATSTGMNCPEGRAHHTAIWTGTEMIVWGGATVSTVLTVLDQGGRYDPLTDTWLSVSNGSGAPSPRQLHSAVWTGTEMIVWGGVDISARLNSGGRYNPSLDAWVPTPTGSDCPAPRSSHTAIWTGTEMIVWGGYLDVSPGIADTGGRFNPSSGDWIPTSTGENCPLRRHDHSAVWTGTEMIVWGGSGDSEYLKSGGRYSPQTDSWLPTSMGDSCFCLNGGSGHTAIWTGTEMIVWGGLYNHGRYSPANDSWTPVHEEAFLSSMSQGHTAVWTGTEMIVWGGTCCGGEDVNSGGRYSPASDSWVQTSTSGSTPAPRFSHTAVWTGSEMVVWGGANVQLSSYVALNSGGIYSPALDAWSQTSQGAGCPIPRYDHTAVWNGSEMIVWGGYGLADPPNWGDLNSGGRYNPVSDSWQAVSAGTGCPAPRSNHVAIWDGVEMIVWGGREITDCGARYNPDNDAWTLLSSEGCPASTSYASGVWTGTEMIVWGGLDYGWNATTSAGGRYNPVTNLWVPTSTGANCPTAREGHVAVWTGDAMIVWGGYRLNSGGRYDPVSDAWVPTSTGTWCPPGATYPTGVWTGSELLIWGDGGSPNTPAGGRYSPTTDIWSGVSTGLYCPFDRSGNTAVWTGSDMIIWGGGLTGLASGGCYSPGTKLVPRIISPAVGCLGTPASLSTDTYATYQWAKDGNDIPGGTERILTTSEPGTYTVNVADASGCSGISNPLALVFETPPAPTISGETVGCPEPGIELATETWDSYQWMKDDVDIPGARSRTYMATTSGTYKVRVTDHYGCAGVSGGHSLTTLPAPSPQVNGFDANTCPALSVLLSTGAAPGYQWNYNGAAIPGATEQTYSAWVPGNYSVTVPSTVNECVGTSSVHGVTIDPCSSPCEGWPWMNPKPDGNMLHAVVYGSGKYVAVGNYGKIELSLDGSAWARQLSGTHEDLAGVEWNGSLFVAVGTNGLILSSPDGFAWTPRSSSTSRNLWAVAWRGSQFLAVGEGRTILTSPDGTVWTKRNGGMTYDYLSGIAWSGSLYIVVGGDWSSNPNCTSLVMTSQDGVAWTTQTINTSRFYGYLNGVAWSGTGFAAVGDGFSMTSTDGLSWSYAYYAPYLQSVIWDGSEYISVDYSGQGIFVSADGLDWQPPSSHDALLVLWGLCEGQNPNRFVAVGMGTAVGTNANEWQAFPLQGNTIDYLYAVTAGDIPNGKPAVAVGLDYSTFSSALMSSTDGYTWDHSVTKSDYGFLTAITWSSRLWEYLATGWGTAYVSLDGINWDEDWIDYSSAVQSIAESSQATIGVGFDFYNDDYGVVYQHDPDWGWVPLWDVWADAPLYAITFDQTLQEFVAVGDFGTILVGNAAGNQWRTVTSGTMAALYGVTSGTWSSPSGGTMHLLIAVGDSGTILASSDGVIWTQRPSGVTSSLGPVIYGTGQFEAIANGSLISSADGMTWSTEKLGTGSFYSSSHGIAYGAFSGDAPQNPGHYLVVGDHGDILAKQGLRASAVLSPTSGVAPLLVSCVPAVVGGQGPYTYDWDFGDGSPHSNAMQLNHRYQHAGTFGVTLVVKDCHGMVAQDRQVVTVGLPSVYRVPYSAIPTLIITSDHGTTATVMWDATNCPSDGYHLLYGYGSGLPTYSVAGGACGLGVSGTAVWHNVPDPSSDGRGFLWFLIVGDNGDDVEGSWGQASSGQERGIGPSGVCGMTIRSSGDCGTTPQLIPPKKPAPVAQQSKGRPVEPQ